MLTLGLFAFGGMVDLALWYRNDSLSATATAYAAQLAAQGRPDAEVQDAARQLAQGVFAAADAVSVTPCWQRTLGAASVVETRWPLQPLTPLAQTFWQQSGHAGRPIVHRVQLTVQQPCVEVPL